MLLYVQTNIWIDFIKSKAQVDNSELSDKVADQIYRPNTMYRKIRDTTYEESLNTRRLFV